MHSLLMEPSFLSFASRPKQSLNSSELNEGADSLEPLWVGTVRCSTVTIIISITLVRVVISCQCGIELFQFFNK